MNLTRDVAAAAGRRIERGRIVGNAIRNADIQAVLQDIEEMPGAIGKAPLLHARGGLRGSIGNVAVNRRGNQNAIALVANVQRICICKEETERKRYRSGIIVLIHAAGEGCWETRQDGNRLLSKLSGGSGR